MEKIKEKYAVKSTTPSADASQEDRSGDNDEEADDAMEADHAADVEPAEGNTSALELLRQRLQVHNYSPTNIADVVSLYLRHLAKDIRTASDENVYEEASPQREEDQPQEWGQ